MVVVCGRMGGLPNENGYGGVQGGVEWWKNGCGRPDVRARGRMSGPGRMSGVPEATKNSLQSVVLGPKFVGFCG